MDKLNEEEMPALSQETIDYLFEQMQDPSLHLDAFNSTEITASLHDVCANNCLPLPVPEFVVPTTSHNSYTGLQTMPPAQSQEVPQELTPFSLYGFQVPNTCSSSSLSANANFAGPLNFSVSFHPPEKSTKNAAWTFSDMRQKLFVVMGVNCPISFHTNIPPPIGTSLVVTSVYINTAYSLSPVERCLNHQNPSEPYNHDHPALDHLIRCSSHEGIYSTDEKTGQKLLTLSYTNPDVGTDASTYLYKFMCWSSCAGGMNRRQIRVIFSLQLEGKCIGQRSFEVRVCACPGRDRKAEERQYLKTEGEDKNPNDNHDSEPSLVSDLKRGLLSMKTSSSSSPPPPAKKKKVNDSNMKFTLNCSDADEYTFMRAVRKAYRANRKNGRNAQKRESSEEE